MNDDVFFYIFLLLLLLLCVEGEIINRAWPPNSATTIVHTWIIRRSLRRREPRPAPARSVGRNVSEYCLRGRRHGLLFFLPRPSASMHIGPGSVVSHELWEFVTKFAFTYAQTQGQIVGEVNGVIRVATPAYLVIYDDQDFSWSHIYNNESLTCDFALLPRSKGGPLVSKYKLMPHKDNLIEIKITEHLRPRLGLCAGYGKCDAKKETKKQRAIDLHNLHWLDDGAKSTELKLGKIFVDLTITNVHQGYEKQFSFDEQGMLPVTLVFLFLYIVCFSIQCVMQPKSNFDSRGKSSSSSRGYRNSLNGNTNDKRPYPLVKLWSILVMLEMGALIFRSVDLTFYAHSGEEATKFRWSRLLTLQLFGWMMDIGSQLRLALLVSSVERLDHYVNEIRGKTLFCFIFAMDMATCALGCGGLGPASTYFSRVCLAHSSYFCDWLCSCGS